MAEFFERRPLFKSPILDGALETQISQLELITDICGAPASRTWIGTTATTARSPRRACSPGSEPVTGCGSRPPCALR